MAPRSASTAFPQRVSLSPITSRPRLKSSQICKPEGAEGRASASAGIPHGNPHGIPHGDIPHGEFQWGILMGNPTHWDSP